MGSQHSAPEALRVSDEPVVLQKACEPTDDAEGEFSQIDDREPALGDFMVEGPLDEVTLNCLNISWMRRAAGRGMILTAFRSAWRRTSNIEARPAVQQADPDQREDSGGQDAVMVYGAVDGDVEHPDEVLLIMMKVMMLCLSPFLSRLTPRSD